MLLRLAYLGVTNALAMLRLLPISDHAKDAEILALRHEIMVLQRQLHGQQVRFTPTDRAFLAALLLRLPRTVLHRIRLLVRPETVLSGIAYGPTAIGADHPAAVGADGTWRLGPAAGRWTKTEPAYIGATAREQARRATEAARADLDQRAARAQARQIEIRARPCRDQDAQQARRTFQ